MSFNDTPTTATAATATATATASQRYAFHYDRQDEYAAARRAGAEAIEIGRETLEATSRQGEQLEHAEKMADETSYQLEKAGRILRGMTWSGWVANMFAKELRPPSSADDDNDNDNPSKRGDKNSKLVPTVYENVPAPCRDAAQAIQNYHANLKVLAACETQEQEETCHLICENMYQVAKQQVDKLHESAHDVVELMEDHQEFIMQLQKDLGLLRSRQDIKRRILVRQLQEEAKQAQQAQQANNYQKTRQELNLSNENDKKETSYKPVDIGFDCNDPETRKVLQAQDEHLDAMANNLDELGNLAINLGEATEKQGTLVDILDNKSDSILETSRMVTRRAERLIQKKAWSPVKPVFHANVSIQHIPTQKYLAVTNGTLVLRRVLDNESCVFGLWKRQGDIFGLQSKFNRRWVGQNLLGNLECNASSFGRRQEFEVTEKGWDSTPLLCASAGWGAGSYVVVRGKEETVNVATSGTVSSKTADLWCLKETHRD